MPIDKMEGLRDIIIVDDDEDYRRSLAALSETYGFSPRTFGIPSAALAYFKRRTLPPVVCVVDMKPYSANEISTIPRGELTELDVPEQLYWHFHERGWRDRLIFISGHRSEHDDKVLARTGAEFRYKADSPSIIDTLREMTESVRPT